MSTSHGLPFMDRWTCLLAGLGLTLLLGSATLEGANPREPRAIPDFTQGNPPDLKEHDWTLGPTGARGWMYAWRLETRQARQIYITQVEPGSPAADVLQVGDVILGVEGQPFTSDARVALGQAITRAEQQDAVLRLLRWRAGEESQVELSLAVLGEYSPTAPYDCEKSQRILDEGCEALAKRMRSSRKRGNPIERSLNALALLASDNPDYLPLVREEAQWVAQESEKWQQGLRCWWDGYANLFLAEYVLATGDESVLPALRRMTLEIANGQSGVGSWGHRFADPQTGILGGYGAMNSPGLVLTMSLVLAREAGVDDPVVDTAIDRSKQFLSFYIGKGAIPYGDHHPWIEAHEGNGKCGAGAVLFDLLGHAEGAEFFSRMSVACHGPARDTGHTGNFFNILWAMPGVARSGPVATGGWMNEFGWHFDLARRWDGTFVYQGAPGTAGDSYKGWDCTGAYLLSYAMPRKALRLTGAQPSVAPQLEAQAVEELLDDGRDWNPTEKFSAYKNRTTEQLLTALSSWSPVVRDRAAQTLGQRNDEAILPRLLELLESDDPYSNLGACAAIRAMGPRASQAVPHLRATLADDDLWLRVQAGEALSAIGAEAQSSVPDLLQLAARVRDDDPRGMTQRYIAFLLFHPGRIENVRGMLAKNLDHVDRPMLYTAVRAVLQNEDGRARTSVASVYDLLTFEEIQPLLPAIYQAVVEPAPSGVMFADGIRLRGLEILAEYRIEEGLPLCVELMEPDRWGKQRRLKACVAALRKYGGAARSQLEPLREIEQQLRQHREARMLADVLQDIQQLIAELEASTDQPELRSLPQ